MDASFIWYRIMPERRDVALEKEEHMTDAHLLAIDLAKRSFQVCATALGGAALHQDPLSRTIQEQPADYACCV